MRFIRANARCRAFTRSSRKTHGFLDPRWNLLADELDISTLGVEFEPEEGESGLRLDYLFALVPVESATLDEVIVVEIKRGTNADGSVRKASDIEVQKFHSYVLQVRDYYARNTKPPRVRGVFIAQDYTRSGDRMRKSLEANQDVRLTFRTWEMAIDETERMHLAWLKLSKLRAARE